MHRNPEICETLTTFFSLGTKLLLPSWLLGFQHEERETQFLLGWLFHLTPPRAAHLVDPLDWPRPGPKINSLRPASDLNSSGLPGPESESQLTAFFQKSPKILSPSLLGMTLFTSLVSFPIRGFYCDICDYHIFPRKREHLRSICAPTRALSRTVLSLTKPNDKI